MSDSPTLLSPKELRDLSLISSFRSTAALVLDWLAILGSVSVASHFKTPLVWLAALLVCARQQHALAILMHDAAHSRLYRSKRLNDRIGHFLCSAPILFSLAAYRYLHLIHHQDPMSEKDPDLSMTGGYPVKKASLRRKLLRDLTGQTSPKIVRFYSLVPPHRLNAHWWVKHPFVSYLLVHFVLFLTFTKIAGPWGYPFFWFVPLATALIPMLRIRAITEHAGYAPDRDQSKCSRTLLPSWQTAVLAPHQVNYHVEHHLYPSVPFYRLPELHRILSARTSIKNGNYFTSYLPVIRSLTR